MPRVKAVELRRRMAAQCAGEGVMVQVFAVLLACQLAGEVMARMSGVPVPGPVIGLMLLFALMAWRQRISAVLPAASGDGTLEATAHGLLRHLSLLFVPAGVGVIQRLDVLGRDGVALVVALVVSSVLGLVVSALVFRALARRSAGGPA